MNTDTTPVTNDPQPTMAQTYKLTYDSLLLELPEGMKKRVLAMVGKATIDKEAMNFIKRVAKVSETAYDQMIAKNKITLNKDLTNPQLSGKV